MDKNILFKLYSINKFVENDLSLECFKTIFNQNKDSKEDLNFALIKRAESYNLFNRSINLINNYNAKNINKMVRSLDNKLNIEILEWLIQLSLEMKENNVELNYVNLRAAFIYVVDKSNIYDICKLMESKKYKGYYDFIENMIDNNIK